MYKWETIIYIDAEMTIARCHLTWGRSDLNSFRDGKYNLYRFLVQATRGFETMSHDQRDVNVAYLRNLNF